MRRLYDFDETLLNFEVIFLVLVTIIRQNLINDQISSYEDINNLVFKNKNTNKSIKIYYNIDDKIGINYIKSIISDLETYSENISGLVVLNTAITTFAKQFLNSEQNSQCIEYFKETDLMTNKTKHYLIPKHILLSNDEKIKLLSDLQCDECHLPRIKNTDPIAQYYGSKLGDIFKIIRHDDNTPSIYYRLCI